MLSSGPGDLARFWFAVRPMLREALRASEDLVTMHTLYQQVRWGNAGIFFVAVDGEPVGAFVTEDIPTAKGVQLNVPFCGFEGGRMKVLTAAWDKFEELAQQYGYQSTKFISGDKRFASIAKRRGYRARYVEYVKEY